MPTILAVDSGNSHIKWGIHSANHWLFKSELCNTGIDNLDKEWCELKPLDFIVASSVSHPSIKSRLNQLLNKTGSDPYWVVPKAYQCGVTNNYINTSRLGSDRWASMIAAWNFFHYPCLVVNVGTAMTIDAISENGVFIGGYIFPGPYLLKQSLVENTQIGLIETADYQDFPQSTSDAIQSGIITALIAFIEKIQQLFLKHQGYSVNKCILTGGGAHIIKPYLQVPCIEVDNLVLEGLTIIANDLLQSD